MAPKAPRVVVETEDGERREGRLIAQWIDTGNATRCITVEMDLNVDDPDDFEALQNAQEDAKGKGKGKGKGRG